MLINKNITAAFTGHRPDKLPWRDDIEDPRCLDLSMRILRELEAAYKDGYRYFLCGMAMGCDMLFAETVLRLKTKYKDCILCAVVPYKDQPSAWDVWNKERWRKILKNCDEKWILSQKYYDGCLTDRNKHMVENSSLLIAVFDGSRGGTGHTVHFAQKQGIEVVVLPIEISSL